MIYWYHVMGSAVVRVVPLSLLHALSDLLAPWLARCWRGQYERARRNMRQVLGSSADHREVEHHLRNVFRNYARYMIDVLWMVQVDDRRRARDVILNGVEDVDAALARGKGVMLVTGHIGNWDLAGAVLASRGYPVHELVETLQPKRWNDRVQSIRARIRLRPIPVETGARDMYATLARNEILAMAVDRPLAMGGVSVRFFGRPTRVPEGVARLAIRTGARVIVSAIVREDGRFVNRTMPLPFFEPTGDRQEDARRITQAVMDRLEEVIRKYPDQWYMFRDMWPGDDESAVHGGANEGSV